MCFIYAKIIHLIDGNKRVALASSLVFLDINEYILNCKDETLYNNVMNVAKGEIKKNTVRRITGLYTLRRSSGSGFRSARPASPPTPHFTHIFAAQNATHFFIAPQKCRIQPE